MKVYRMFTDSSQFLPWLFRACLAAPVLEEAVYRFALCAPTAPILGRWPVIILSGLAFGWLHFIYGNPGPDNLIAGFLLAWAYLKSESILVPVVLHALGNFFVFLTQAGLYYVEASGLYYFG